MEAQLRARGLPLVSCESARPLRDFDVVGFSLQFELTYTNVLTMLDLGRHPAARRRDRGEDDPLVLAGGPTATHPEPLAPFIDAFVDRRRRRARSPRSRSSGRARARSGRAARGAPPRAGAAQGRLRPVALRDAPSRPTPASPSSTAPRVDEAPMPVVRTLVDDLNQLPVPRRRPDRRPRGDLRPHVDRDRARLHRGVPLLPGGDDLPPGARARPGADRRHRRQRRARRAATTRRA